MPDGITVEVTSESLTSLLVRLSEASGAAQAGMRRGVNAAAIDLVSYIKRDLLSGQVLKNRTGNLRRAVFSRMDGDVGVVGVGPEAPYGKIQEYGVAHPWTITAHGAIIAAAGRSGLDVSGMEGAKALHFKIGGEGFFAQSVTIPGLTAKPFMTRGLTERTPKLRDIIQRFVSAAVAKKDVAA
jgi:hypothetical protein